MEQLGAAPSRFGLLSARQHLVAHGEPLGILPGTAETRSQPRKKQTHVVMEAGLGQSLESRLEQLRASAILPSLDEQYPLEALRPDVPHLQCMSSGEVERQSHVVVGGREIADVQRDGARREEERVQKR